MRILDLGQNLFVFFRVHLPGEMTSSDKWGGLGFQLGHSVGLEGKEPGRRRNRGIGKILGNFREKIRNF